MRCLDNQAPDWRDSSIHKEFFNMLASVLNIAQLSDWYKVKAEDMHANGGKYLLENYYGGCLYKVLISSRLTERTRHSKPVIRIYLNFLGYLVIRYQKDIGTAKITTSTSLTGCLKSLNTQTWRIGTR